MLSVNFKEIVGNFKCFIDRTRFYIMTFITLTSCRVPLYICFSITSVSDDAIMTYVFSVYFNGRKGVGVGDGTSDMATVTFEEPSVYLHRLLPKSFNDLGKEHMLTLYLQ